MAVAEIDQESEIRDLLKTLKDLCHEILMIPNICAEEFMYQAYLVDGLRNKYGYVVTPEYSIEKGSQMDIVIHSKDGLMLCILELKCPSIKDDIIDYGKDSIPQLGRYMMQTQCKYGFLISFPEKRLEKTLKNKHPDESKIMKMAGVHILRFETIKIVPSIQVENVIHPSGLEIQITNNSFHIIEPQNSTFTYNGIEFYGFIKLAGKYTRHDHNASARNNGCVIYLYNGENDRTFEFTKSEVRNPQIDSMIPIAVVEGQRIRDELDQAIIEKDKAIKERNDAIAERNQVKSELDKAIAEKQEIVDELIIYKTKVEKEMKSMREHMISICTKMEIVTTIRSSQTSSGRGNNE